MVDRIDVRVRQAAGITGQYHQFIVYTKDVGQPNQTRFICEGDVNGLKLTASCVPYSGAGLFPNSDAIVSYENLSSGTFAIINNAIAEIHARQFNYDVGIGKNSNATITTALRAAGLPPADFSDIKQETPGAPGTFHLKYPTPGWTEILDIPSVQKRGGDLLIDRDGSTKIVNAPYYFAPETIKSADLGPDGLLHIVLVSYPNFGAGFSEIVFAQDSITQSNVLFKSSGITTFVAPPTSEITVNSNNTTRVVDRDAGNGKLWDSRWVDLDAANNVTADLRDYSAISDRWLANHAFPTADLWQADETFATDMSAAVTRDAAHGGAIGDASPNPIAYERAQNAFSLGSFDIDPSFSAPGLAAVRLVEPSSFASSFDTSGFFYFNGSSSWGTGARVSFPTNFFDTSFGGIDFSFPVILDLNGDGVRIDPRTGSNVFFDADRDGALERTSWVGTGDGLLVHDLDGDGRIQANEMAFASRTDDPDDTDLEAVAALYDANGDGKLDAGDPAWVQLRVWADPNRNAVTDNGELSTLGAYGITSISLVSDRNSFTLPDGSRINGFGSFVMNGQTRTLADAALAFETEGFSRSTQAELTKYTSQDGATVKTYYDAANLPSYNDSPGLIITLGSDYAYEGVLGGDKPDLADIRNSTKPLVLYGGAGNDELRSGVGKDVLDGGTGSDKLHAGGGDDTIYFDATDLEVDGGSGYDTGILTWSPATYVIDLAAKGLVHLVGRPRQHLGQPECGRLCRRPRWRRPHLRQQLRRHADGGHRQRRGLRPRRQRSDPRRCRPRCALRRGR